MEIQEPTYLQLSPNYLAKQEIQTRTIEVSSHATLMKAALASLQDLGFIMTSSDLTLGVLVGEKRADATDSKEITGAYVQCILGAFANKKCDPTYNEEQHVQVALLAYPNKQETKERIRVQFSRVVLNNKQEVTVIENLQDANTYQNFFSRLEQSLFLNNNGVG